MRVFSSLRCSRKETLRVHLCIVGGYHPFDENYPFVINGRQTIKITQQQQHQHQRHDTFSSSAKMTTNDFEKNAKKASAFSSAVSPSSKRRRRGRNDKMLDFSSFLCVALCCVFLASWAPTSAHAAAKAITWTFSAQTVTMLTTDTLTISWSNIGSYYYAEQSDVYYSTTGTCSGGTRKTASSTSGSYTTTSGEMDVGTHYFYCGIGTHCANGMYVTVNVIGTPCDASAAPTNGAVGTCTSTLASGSTCQPTCNTGYTVSGTSSCLAGTFTTAECSVAPSPPPPSPPPPAAAAVQAEMQLTGYSAAEFDDDKKTNFKTGMAKYLGVDSAAITITSVVDVTAGRRKLSAVDSVLKVEFTVEATTFSDTTALETKLVVTDVTTMENELNTAGLAVSNIVAPTTITAFAPPPSPPPSPPPPASTSPLLSVVKLIAATAALAFFAC